MDGFGEGGPISNAAEVVWTLLMLGLGLLALVGWIDEKLWDRRSRRPDGQPLAIIRRMWLEHISKVRDAEIEEQRRLDRERSATEARPPPEL